MSAPHVNFKLLQRTCGVAPSDTLSTGITKQDTSKPILVAGSFDTQSADGITFKTILQTNTLLVNAASDAAFAFGQHLFTYPLGWIMPVYTLMEMTSLAPTGLSAAAGEIGAGSVIASGANATLGAVGATSEDIMAGKTIASHVATTTLVSVEDGEPVGAPVQTEATVLGSIDGSATAVKFHANVATTWNQTAAENLAFSFKIIHIWRYIGSGHGVN